MHEADDLVAALMPVVGVLSALDIRFYVGGSVASSFHGASRSTMDVDLHCELQEHHVARFISELGTDFYVSETAMRDALSRRSCFNLIHYPTSFKVDIFVSKGRPFDLDSLARADRHPLGSDKSMTVPILSVEDTILVKLEWFRLGDESSERQWDDVTRLARLVGDEADHEYLLRTARSIGVDDLLEKLFKLR